MKQRKKIKARNRFLRISLPPIHPRSWVATRVSLRRKSRTARRPMCHRCVTGVSRLVMLLSQYRSMVTVVHLAFRATGRPSSPAPTPTTWRRVPSVGLAPRRTGRAKTKTATRTPLTYRRRSPLLSGICSSLSDFESFFFPLLGKNSRWALFRLESDVKRLKVDLQSSRQTEQELRNQINNLISSEKSLSHEMRQLHHDNDNLQNKWVRLNALWDVQDSPQIGAS